jgi:hypothetical protein
MDSMVVINLKTIWFQHIESVFVKNGALIGHIFKKIKIKSKLPDFYDRFQQVTKYKRIFFFLFSYVVYSQIWLNLLVDDH